MPGKMLKQPGANQISNYDKYLYDKIVPADHLLRKINQAVDFSFAYAILKDRYTEGFGRPAEDPEFMLRLCLLQYLYGDSDRQVVENARLNLAYKYFLGLALEEEVPDYTTLSYFRAKRLGEAKFRQVFEQIVQQCKEKGLVKGKRQIIDSTHIIADMAMTSLTGLIKLCRRNVLKEIEKQNPGVAQKLGIKDKDLQFTQQDKYASKEEGLQKEMEKATGLLDAVTQELKRGSLKPQDRLKDHLGLLEKAIADRAAKAEDRLVSPVDKDARAGKKNSKSWAGYKGHILIEADNEIITAVETTPANKDDGSQLRPLLHQQQANLALLPEEFLADKAYDAGANLEVLDSNRISGYISLSENTNPRGEDLFTRKDFQYDPVNNTLTCPAGRVAKCQGREMVFREDQQRKGLVFQFIRKQCEHCELKPLCFTSNSKYLGRSVRVNYYEPFFQQMEARLKSEAGKAIYKQRYRVEQKVADLARWCGMRRCRYRGLARAGIHTLLAAIVSNVKRMANLLGEESEKPSQELMVAT